MSVKNKFLEIRLQLGYKFQKDFAMYLNIDPSHYNRYEKNIVQPNLDTVYRVLTKLQINFFDLFYEE